MGIQGLLPTLKSICKKSHIKNFANQKVAVDAYVWLHRGAYACGTEICQNIKTDKYLKYCMHMVNMMKYNKVIPVLVFDGARLPSKSGKEDERRGKRRENMQKARALLQAGKKTEADEYFRKAVDITPQMAFTLMQELQRNSVEYIVSPYEADAQLAYLAKSGYVSCVVTEDSDLVPYGSPRIFFKMDKYGEGYEYNITHLATNKELDFKSFTPELLIRMCVLSGCDYLDSLPGIGVKTAHKIVKDQKTIPKILNYLQKTNATIPPDYEDGLRRAELTFKHQRVFDPVRQELVPLHPIPEDIDPESLDFCGPILDREIVRRICTGLIDPMTHESFTDIVGANRITVTRPFIQPPRPTVVQTNSISSYFRPSIVKRPFNPPRPFTSQGTTTPPVTPSSSTSATPKILLRSKYFSQEETTIELNLEGGQSGSGCTETSSLATSSQSNESNMTPPSSTPPSSSGIPSQPQIPSQASSTSTPPLGSQHSVCTISSQPSQEQSSLKEGDDQLVNSQDSNTGTSLFTSPLINNSIPKIGMATRPTTSTLKSGGLLAFLTKRKSNSQNSQEVITIDSDEELEPEAEEKPSSSQTSLWYDILESPPNKRKNNSAAKQEAPPSKRQKTNPSQDSSASRSQEERETQITVQEEEEDIIEITPVSSKSVNLFEKYFRKKTVKTTVK